MQPNVNSEAPVIGQVKVSDTNFIVIDFETTGLNAETNRVTEVGLVHVLGNEILGEFTSLVNPGQFIPSYITDLTGITNEMVYDQPDFNEVLPKIKEYLRGNTNPTVIGGHNVSFDYKFLVASAKRAGYEKPELPSICTCRLARRLNKSLLSKSLYSLSRHYKIKVKRRHRALDDARATAEILIHLLKKMEEEYGIDTLEDALSFQYRKIYEKDKIPPNIKKIKEQIKDIPAKPGVYKMYSSNGELIYIGKAKSLHDRVNSYFYHNTSHTPKVRKLIRQVRKVDFEITGSELSALILESSLIKKHKPHYNSAIKRYKRFPFIKIDVKNKFPKAEKTFEVKLDNAKYYGPFRSSFTVESLLERINKTYFLRKCKDKHLKPHKKHSVCIYHDIKQCKAPCNLSQQHDEYQKEVKKVIAFLESEASPGALKSLESKMQKLSDDLQFEEASLIRDRLEDLRKVLTNLELTNADINLKNYIVKCHSAKNEYELFFISGGKLAKSLRVDMDSNPVDISSLMELINNLYFRGNLFSSVIYNNNGKFTREELDSMKIISNWIYLNNSTKTIRQINEKTVPESLVEFAICYS